VLTLLRWRRSDDREAGVVAIIVAVFAVVMFGFASLVVDMGIAREARRQAQNAADASALAAVGALYPSGSNTPDFAAASARVKQYAADNFGTTDAEWAACSTTNRLAYSPATTCISYDSATDPRRVRVVVPGKHVPSAFGAVFGYKGIYVNALADATLDDGQHPVCAFCILGTSTHNLQNGNLTVVDGDIWANGDTTIGGNGHVTAATTYVAGTISPVSLVTGGVQQNSQVVVDPLASMAMPSWVGLSAKTDPCTQGPGRYGAVNLTGGGTCTLAPGLYVFTDLFSIGGSRNFVADGVTLYFTCGSNGVVGPCSSDSTPGYVDQGGGGTFRLTAPTTGATTGVAVVLSRDNTAVVSLHGSGNFTLDGTVYAPAATVDIRGGSFITPQRTWVVTGDVTFSGNGACFKTQYVPTVNVTLPKSVTGLIL